MFKVIPDDALSTYEGIVCSIVFTIWSVRSIIDEIKAFRAWRKSKTPN